MEIFLYFYYTIIRSKSHYSMKNLPERAYSGRFVCIIRKSFFYS